MDSIPIRRRLSTSALVAACVNLPNQTEQEKPLASDTLCAGLPVLANRPIETRGSNADPFVACGL